MQKAFQVVRKAAVPVVLLSLLAACGGGGGGGSNEVAQSCSPNNPYRVDATGPVIDASLTVEKQWVRGYVNDVYLWYDEVPNVNPADPLFSADTTAGFYTSINNYFNALLTPALTPSGKFKDQFSFTFPTRQWDELLNSGSSAGWGIEWHFDTFTTTSISGVKVAYVHASSPAEIAGFQRGDVLTSIGGLPASANTANAVDALLARLFPAVGDRYAFVFNRGGSAVNGTLTSGPVTLTPIDHSILTVGASKVGYLLFNDHVLTSERPMINAIAAMQQQGVSDLVLDLRYNGGGYLYLASELAYMIAGPSRTAGKSFETTVFNNKQSARNEATPFFDLRLRARPGHLRMQHRRAAAHAGPRARVRADRPGHLFGQRRHHQWPARHRRRRAHHRRHHLRQALRLLRRKQLRHHLLSARVQGRQPQGLRRLRRRLRARRHRQQPPTACAAARSPTT